MLVWPDVRPHELCLCCPLLCPAGVILQAVWWIDEAAASCGHVLHPVTQKPVLSMLQPPAAHGVYDAGSIAARVKVDSATHVPDGIENLRRSVPVDVGHGASGQG